MTNDQTLMNLAFGDIDVSRSSFVDPNGFVFEFEGSIYRAITGHRDLYLEMLQAGVFDRLSNDVGLVETHLAPFRIDEIGCDLVLHHRRILPESYCVEWPPSMLKEAALSTLALNAELAARDCWLQDAHPWNILFDGPRSIFIDLTSIAPIGCNLPWQAYQQFLSFFLNPLDLCAMGKGNIARRLLFDVVIGITQQESLMHQTASGILRHPLRYISSTFAVKLANRLAKDSAKKQRFQERIMKIPIDPAMRRKFLDRLRRRVEGTSVRPTQGPWRDYYSEISDQVDQGRKVTVVSGIFDQLAPKTVLDVGCNTGRFSLLAAERGVRVTALDTSEAAVDALFVEARKRDAPVLPLVADILGPTPAFGFMAQQFRPLLERVRSEVVLCLGLMHHLHVVGKQPFSRIAEVLDAVTERTLIFEYVDPSDDNLHLIDHGRPITYSLPEVMRALEENFNIVVTESDRPTRSILICTKKTP